MEAFLLRYRAPLALAAVSIFSIVVSIILIIKSSYTSVPIQFSDDASSASGSALGVSFIQVDIEGAIVKPGVYSLPEGSRVEDLIVAAGGVSKEVDAELFAKSMNRAMKLVDGAKIFIPAVNGTETSHNLNESQNELISINFATEAQLDSLPGVGPVTAAKIIANRPYQTIEELISKKAVSASVFEKIKNQLSL